jgi:hypothetical protein
MKVGGSYDFPHFHARARQTLSCPSRRLFILDVDLPGDGANLANSRLTHSGFHSLGGCHYLHLHARRTKRAARTAKMRRRNGGGQQVSRATPASFVWFIAPHACGRSRSPATIVFRRVDPAAMVGRRPDVAAGPADVRARSICWPEGWTNRAGQAPHVSREPLLGRRSPAGPTPTKAATP